MLGSCRFFVSAIAIWHFRAMSLVIVMLCLLPFPANFGGPLVAADDVANRPNVVVIMADDWSWPHASILGDQCVKTPNFDRIAKEGVLFENAFVSAPSCTPSRFSIATGQYHWRLGEADSLGGSLAVGVAVYPELLAAAGYFTGFSRKGAAPSQHVYRGSDPFGTQYRNFTEFLAKSDNSLPFCFWYGAGEPHRPYDWHISKASEIDFAKMKVPSCLPDNETTRTDLGDYYLRVQKLDQLAGEIIEALESSGQLDETIIVMTSDNGMPFPRCKATLYDLGTRVPLAIRWGSKVKGGSAIQDFVSLTDLAPTFLEAAGLPVPAEMTGRSLLPQLLATQSGLGDLKRDHVLVGREKHVYSRPARAIRTSDYLYIRNFSPSSWPTGEVPAGQPLNDFSVNPWPTERGAFSFDVDPSPTKQWMLNHSSDNADVQRLCELAFESPEEEELYDLKNDPDQMHNVVDRPDLADVRKKLSAQLSAELRATADPRFVLPEHATFDISGWTVHLHDRLWQNESEKTKSMLVLLSQQLDRVIKVVPRKALVELRKVPIWINPRYEGVRPTAEYHPGAGWLRDNGRNPDMAKAVEITTVSNFEFENRRMPYLMLHELAHAYHDRVLGFDEPAIVAAFKQARDSGGYDSVQRFNGRTTVMDKAYALSNHKEYFAESTEAYFGRNDFFPFDRSELKSHDIQIHNLLQVLWGDTAE